MKKNLAITLLCGLSLSLGACSSSKKVHNGVDAGADENGAAASGDAPTGDAAANTENAANTDAVPGNPDQPAPPAENPNPPENPPVAANDAPPAQPFQGTGNFDQYTVQEGDTLMKIAFETYGDLYQWKKIYEDNKDTIKSANAIPKGSVLKVEKSSSPVAVERNGEKYLIKIGDTLGKISDDVYGTAKKWKQIWENNKQLIHDPNRIFAGFFLYYTMTPEEKQQADQLKQNRPSTPAPLAGGKASNKNRAPANAGGAPADAGGAPAGGEAPAGAEASGDAPPPPGN